VRGALVAGGVLGGLPPKRDANGIARREGCVADVGRGGRGGLGGRTCIGREALCGEIVYDGYAESGGMSGSGGIDEKEISGNLVCKNEE